MNIDQNQFQKYKNLFDQYDLWIWDFDKTILKIHAYRNEITSQEVLSVSWKRFIRDFADPFFFKDLINHLKLIGKKYAIASFGTFNVINNYLERLMGNDKDFNNLNIKTPLVADQRYHNYNCPPSDKNQIIIDLSRQYNIPLNRIIFFDNSYKNIVEAHSLGVRAVHLPNFFTRDSLEQLLREISPSENKKNLPNTNPSSQTKSNVIIEGFNNDSYEFFTDQDQIIKNEKQKDLGEECFTCDQDQELIEGFTIEKDQMTTLTNPPAEWWFRVQSMFEILAILLLVYYLYDKFSR